MPSAFLAIRLRLGRPPLRRVGRWMRPIATAALSLTALALPAQALASPVLPTADPFYGYSGSLTGLAPGTVLKTRTVTLHDSTGSVPLSTTQVLYRTTGERGQPTVTVATIIRPVAAVATKLVSYQTAYDGMAPQCDPSYAVQGGTPTEATNPEELEIMSLMVARGYTVVTSDYEGENDEFGAGQESGYGTLDAIRAAEAQLKLPGSTPVALIGYSGGSIATDFAAELAPSYAPELDIVGAAFGGIPVDYAHNLEYINGSATWGGAIPAVLVGLARAFGINVTPYLSPYGLKVVNSVKDECLLSSLGQYPDLTYQKLFKPSYANAFELPWLVRIFNQTIMGDSGTPREPLFMGVGNTDGVGDDVMVAADDEALAHSYCQRGVSVQFSEYNHDNHGNAALAFYPAAYLFIEERLDGIPATNGCSSIAAGNSLTQLPAPRQSWTLSVTPNRARVGAITRFTFTLWMTDGEVTTAYRGATIHFAGRTARTNRAGRVTIPVGLRSHARRTYRASASVAGRQVSTAVIRIVSERSRRRAARRL